MEAINSNATQGASQTENASGKSGFDMITSVELMFAKLQNDLAVENREYAKSRIEGIKAKQEDQKKISDLIVALRGKIANVDKDDTKVKVDISAGEINKWANKGTIISLDKDGKCTKAAINAAIASLQSVQETKGSDIQQDMIFVQDFMSKVSSYSQGAISAISKSGDVLTAIARG